MPPGRSVSCTARFTCRKRRSSLWTSVTRQFAQRTHTRRRTAGLLRGTPTERAEFYNRGITDGWMDRNEVRALEDMNPRDGLSEMLMSVNAQPLSQLGQPNEEEPTS